MPTPEVEQEGAVPRHGGDSLTLMEKMVVGLLSLMSTAFLAMMGVALRRKNKEQGAEDAVWSISTKTIDRLSKQLDAMSTENDLIRQQKNQFEAVAAQAEARAEIARQAAELAGKAASQNWSELQRMRRNWEKLQTYLFVLRELLAKNGLPIPPEPEMEATHEH